MVGTFEFRGAAISYSTKGKGRTILLIHGFLGNRKIWTEYESRLSKSFKVVSIDLPGHGESECVGYTHNMELLADCTKKLLNHLNVRKVIVIGHSLGGYVALAFGELFPDAVLGLMLINSTAKADTKERQTSRVKMISLVKLDKQKALNLLVPTFFSLKTRNTKRQINGYLKMANICSEQAIIANLEGMKVRKEREIILKFSPFKYHYLIGDQDSIFSAENLKKETKIGENGGFTVIKDSGHMSIIEQKEQVFRAIKSFSKR